MNALYAHNNTKAAAKPLTAGQSELIPVTTESSTEGNSQSTAVDQAAAGGQGDDEQGDGVAGPGGDATAANAAAGDAEDQPTSEQVFEAQQQALQTAARAQHAAAAAASQAAVATQKASRASGGDGAFPEASLPPLPSGNGLALSQGVIFPAAPGSSGTFRCVPGDWVAENTGQTQTLINARAHRAGTGSSALGGKRPKELLGLDTRAFDYLDPKNPGDRKLIPSAISDTIPLSGELRPNMAQNFLCMSEDPGFLAETGPVDGSAAAAVAPVMRPAQYTEGSMFQFPGWEARGGSGSGGGFLDGLASIGALYGLLGVPESVTGLM